MDIYQCFSCFISWWIVGSSEEELSEGFPKVTLKDNWNLLEGIICGLYDNTIPVIDLSVKEA